jgi:DNA polymerase-3 subunit alpha
VNQIQFTINIFTDDDFAKKLIVLLNISDLDPFYFSWGIFFENKGDNLVTFEIMELKKIRKLRQLLKRK